MKPREWFRLGMFIWIAFIFSVGVYVIFWEFSRGWKTTQLETKIAEKNEEILQLEFLNGAFDAELDSVKGHITQAERKELVATEEMIAYESALEYAKQIILRQANHIELQEVIMTNHEVPYPTMIYPTPSHDRAFELIFGEEE